MLKSVCELSNYIIIAKKCKEIVTLKQKLPDGLRRIRKKAFAWCGEMPEQGELCEAGFSQRNACSPGSWFPPV